jgi:hypothetical protein
MGWTVRRRSLLAVALVAMAGSLAACTSDDDGGATPATRAAGTRPPENLRATVIRETVVSPGYRQGVARVDGGWIFSLNNALFRTDDALVETATLTPAIPTDLAARGFNHVGDIDVVDDVVYAPLEQPDYSQGTQVMAVYDARTLAFRDSVDVAQDHNSFVTVDPDTGVAYSMDRFGGRALLRYDTRRDWRPLRPLGLSDHVDRVQGGDVVRGAVWLSTDDHTDGVYRVDLRTGQVQPLGSIGRVDGEGEGIDATALRRGDLHVLTVDAAIVPVRLVDLRLVAS